MNFYDVKEIENFLKENNLSIQKKFSQNFLIREDIAIKIAESLEITPNSLVLEIGCGLASLTNKILQKGCQFIGFEIDWAYIKLLKENFSSNPKFSLIEGDFLKKFDDIVKSIDKTKFDKIILVGNLPYGITKEIFEKVFTSSFNFDTVCFMIQKEVTEKITSNPSSDRYSYISIISQINKDIKIVTQLSPEYFYPMPNIHSDVVLFKKDNTIEILDNNLFFKVAKSLFLSRRKKIKNNLLLSPYLKHFTESDFAKALKESNINENIRGETLSLNEIANLTNNLFRMK
ncbi:MAG: ribosomal RNA small subunit methyltransferase A [Spirochaetes bacterium GWD1_27_9]|nr:MAG: ribosomal RNA small subunit methyltransferase A [Spirochaetes bacterium GWB1_27_13]OHD31085.1 MAG: ribosomal RNA small subunit methyltransferase A [Spirochaetes bacterium GWD1_27_9]